MSSQEQAVGKVFLVGTGPGDPQLLTVRAAHLIAAAELVLYDNLVAQEIMALAPPDCQRIYVGKRRNRHSVGQEEINALMVRYASQGRTVLRLKSGDPFIFGRGGEEIETLVAHRIPFEVVPGVTAALGAAAYAGIPLTHRDFSQACIFVTGHRKDGSQDLDWAALTRPHQTVVVYMGLLGLANLCRQLIAHGLPAHTPAAVVEQATRRRQRVVEGHLANLAERVDEARLVGPTIVIVGQVVQLRAALNWFAPGADGEP